MSANIGALTLQKSNQGRRSRAVQQRVSLTNLKPQSNFLNTASVASVNGSEDVQKLVSLYGKNILLTYPVSIYAITTQDPLAYNENFSQNIPLISACEIWPWLKSAAKRCWNWIWAESQEMNWPIKACCALKKTSTYENKTVSVAFLLIPSRYCYYNQELKWLINYTAKRKIIEI
jgi:hypothetical protein